MLSGLFVFLCVWFVGVFGGVEGWSVSAQEEHRRQSKSNVTYAINEYIFNGLEII